MKLFYAIILGLMVLVSACAQQASQPIRPAEQPTADNPPQEETVVAEQASMPEKEEAKASSGDLRIVGKEGFDPMEATINAGDSLTWINDDKKNLVMSFFKDGKFYLNSAVIKPGEKFEHEFKEKGSYVYRTLAYGVEGKITVQ